MTLRLSARTLVPASCVLMCALAAARCASDETPPDPALGAADVDTAGDDPATRPGGADIVGEGFETADDAAQKAAQLKERREKRDARWKSLSETSRKADAKTLWERAQEQEKSQNWKNAQDAYQGLVVQWPKDANAPKAVELAMQNAFRRGEYGEGLQFFEDALPAFESDPIVSARLRRVLSSTMLAVPHWGTTRGGEYLRNRYEQGRQTQTYAEDRARAIELLEEARTLLAQPSAAASAPKSERAAIDIDLALAVARFTNFDATWHWWWSAGYGAGGPDDGKADAEGEDESADEYRYRDSSWSAALQQARPRGLPVTPNGDVVFTSRPSTYAPGLDDTAKIKFLLNEAQQLDDGPQREIAGEALLQQALLFRTRDGAEKLDRLRGWWWRGSYPYKDAAKDIELEELGDDEVIALVATGVRRTKVPDDEAVPKLLAEVQRLYPKSKAADEAQSMLGLFHQSREQYPKALAAYEAYAKERPKGAHLGDVTHGINVIKQSEASFQSKGPQAAGKQAEVTLKHRNVDGVSVKATRIDIEKITRDFEKAWAPGPRKRDHYDQRLVDPDNFGYVFVHGQDDMARPYLTKEVVQFDVKLKRDPKYAYVEETAKTPLDKPGVWLLEATHDKALLSRTVVVLEKSSIVLKNTAQGPIAWIVDAGTGKPIEGASVDAFMYRSDWRDDRQVRHSRKVTVKTDARGVAMLPKSRDEQSVVSVRAQGAFTVPVQHWLGYQYAGRGYASQEQETAGVIVTDRPVYRPGDTVQLAVWARHKKSGVWEPATNVKEIMVRVYDSRGTEVKLHQGNATRFGSTSLSIPLAKGASLGAYRIEMHADGRYADTGGATFRVEEYKAPEVLVEVKAAGEARLGEKVSAEIVGSYYSGGGASNAKVSYKVFRQDHEVAYAAPSTWDWLYGRGYGRIWYPYTWFGWWDDYGPRRIFWYPWWGPKPEPAKELVKEGEGRLDATGTLKIEIDTGPAKRDLSNTDHKYTIVAEVTDLSRHLVKGEGEIVVTRTAFIAALELEAGWARANDDVNMLITTLSPDGSLMAAKGTLQVDEVLGVADNGAVRGEKRVEDRAVSTDSNGPARVKWRAPKTGQYRFTFVAKDKAGNEVKASSVAWVVGPDFTGSAYKFAGVEIVPDKRTYAPGDTARLLVSADEAGAAILFASKVDDGFLVDWQVIQLGATEKTRIVELPIAKEHSPNFFVEAIAVGDGQVFSEAREMFVPPQGSELNVKLTVPTGDIKPGASADVVVTTTDGQGKPVSAEVALTVFDSALLAIMPDTMVDVRSHLWGRKRHHSMQTIASLGRAQPSWGNTSPPDQQARWQLASRSQQRFQQPVDFLREDNVAVSGSDVLSKQVSSDSGALGLAGSGPGGGGRAKRATGEAEKSAKESPAASAPAPMQMAAADKAEAKKDSDDQTSERRAAGNKVGARGGEAQRDGTGGFEPTVRTTFADTAFFSPSVVTDASGKAKVTVKFPENLTTWKVKAVGLDGDTRAGRGDASMVTTKNLLVRLAAPRFFREKDEVVLSAIVQNKHKDKKSVEVSLDVTDTYLVVQGAKTSRIDVPGNSEARVDFKVKVRGEGAAKVRVTARGSDDGDAKELTFPVLVHGMEKTVARVGSISASVGAKGEKTVEMEVPSERREEETRLVVRTSPSLAGGMIDALPYLLEYPYGCVEQTLSRFVPAVLTKRALQQSGGITLEQLATQRRNLNPQQLTPGGNVDAERLAREVRAYSRNPIYDSKLLDDIVATGLKRIQKMQHGDGGWGWWADDSSSAYMTAHVLAGLLDARDADLPIDGSMIERGRSALRALVESEIYRYRAKENTDWVNDSDAYALWVMSRFGDKHEELDKLLYQRRIKLSPYGKLLLAMAAKNNGDMSRAKLLLENVEQFRKEDKENETSWIETSQVGWWYWWNDDIETNALYVRALDTIRPKDNITPGVVKWLLNHRKNGWYWDSTRDTAQVIAAFANHMQVSGERRPNYDLEILVDGVVKKKVHVDSKNMFAVDADLTLTGKEVGGGKHKITVRKTGEGAVYFNTYLSFFTLEDDIKAEGLEVKVERKYWKLERADRKHTVAGDRGQSLTQTEVAYRKVPMKSGATVKSGDLILVELFVTSKNDYTFLAFEDPKPAGAEAVAVRSGNVHGETWAHMELRDDRVVFFLSELTQGTLKLSYRLRAEIPGSFSAMPTNGFAMYAPEIRANSDELKMRIVE
jgi:uncharacterized protein YfaS (alpha-2-macroglobulin family)